MPDDRDKLDFLLHEMRQWRRQGCVSDDFLTPLQEHYAARRAALVVPPPLLVVPEFDLFSSDDFESRAGDGAQARTGLSAFLEERNIAILHVVGSLLLVAGLIALIGWQWASFGRGILLALFAGLTGALLIGGPVVGRRFPQSGRALHLLGAAILPLNAIAANLLLLHQAWPTVGAWASFVCALIYGLQLRADDHREPLLVPLAAASVAVQILAAAHALPALPQILLIECGWLASAWVCFRAAASVERRCARSCAAAGHGLLTGSLGFALLRAAVGGPPTIVFHTAALAVLAAAVFYGCLGRAFRLSGLSWAALVTASVGIQMLLPPSVDLADRAAAFAVTGLLLAFVPLCDRRFPTSDEDWYAPYRSGAVAVALLVTAGIAVLPMRHDLPHSGLYLLLALVWAGLAAANPEDTAYVYGAAAMLLGSVRTASAFAANPSAAFPVNAEAYLALPALLLAVLGKRLVADHPTMAKALLICAGAAAAWAALGQIAPLCGGDSPAAASGALLLVFAVVMAFWSPEAAFPLLIMGCAGAWIRHYSMGEPAPLAAYSLGIAVSLAVVGARLRSRNYRRLSALLLTIAAMQAAVILLPPSILPYWPLAVASLLWLLEDEWLYGVVFALFTLSLLPHHIGQPIPVALAAAATAAGAAWGALRRERTGGVSLAVAIGTVGAVFAVAHFPAWNLPLTETAFALAACAVVCAAFSGFVPVRLRPLFTEATVLHCALAAAVTPLALVIGSGAPVWGITTLGLVAAILSAFAVRNRQIVFGHAAFAAFYAAFILWFASGNAPLSPDFPTVTLPLALYLLAVAEARPRNGILPLVGVSLLLGPAFVAACLTPGSAGDVLLLVAWCLAAIGVGIARRVRVYLASGLASLIALLALKSWDPMRQVNFGVYLTLLGIATLTAAFLFERRRDDVLRLIAVTQRAFDGWR